MMQLHELKVRKADRRELPEEDEDEAGGTDGDDAQKTGGGRKDSAQQKVESSAVAGGVGPDSRLAGPCPIPHTCG